MGNRRKALEQKISTKNYVTDVSDPGYNVRLFCTFHGKGLLYSWKPIPFPKSEVHSIDISSWLSKPQLENLGGLRRDDSRL